MDVIIESTRVGQNVPGGADLNSGFATASGCSLINAA